MCCTCFQQYAKISFDSNYSYGSFLAITADEAVRKAVLLDKLSDPRACITTVQFDALEQVGRGRHAGQLTHGTKTAIHYVVKILSKEDLVTKQTVQLKEAEVNTVVLALHLRRFSAQRKSRHQIMTEQIVEVLRSRPHRRMEYAELKAVFGDTADLRKLLKAAEFQKFVRTGVVISLLLVCSCSRGFLVKPQGHGDWA